MKTLKENLFGIIIVLLVFVPLIIHDSSPSSYSEEDWAEYAEDQMIEDLEYEREIQEEIAQDEARQNATLYYINNGYYFHDDINCKGLDGYRDNLNITYPDELYEHQELNPCNWCVKSN